MKIAIINDLALPIPPLAGYGGIERGIFDLATGLASRDNQIYVFGPGSSKIRGNNITLFGYNGASLWETYNKDHTAKRPTAAEVTLIETRASEMVQEYREFVLEKLRLLIQNDSVDVINLHWGDHILLRALTKLPRPVVMSLHCLYDIQTQKKLLASQCTFTALTPSHRNTFQSKEKIDVILYGINTEKIPFSPKVLTETHNKHLTLPVLKQLHSEKRDYLLSLSGIMKHKSQRTAIEIARKAKMPLIIAGTPYFETKKEYLENMSYFTNEIEPYIDNKYVYYFGNADEEQKYELMKYATGFLFPAGYEDATWVEPFGRVIAESLATGTPVIGYKHGGAIVDIVKHGTHGFLFDTVEQAALSVRKLSRIDRKVCRLHAATRLDVTRIIDETEAFFTHILLKDKNSTSSFVTQESYKYA